MTLGVALAAVTIALLQLFYSAVYAVHPDVAGGALSGRLALALDDAFQDYVLYFPPAERFWFSLASWLSDISGMRLDLTVVAMTTILLLFSVGMGFYIRRESVGVTPAFLLLSLGILVVVPILFMNAFGMREHVVVLGLWPYFVMRVSDPDGEHIGWKTRLVLGLWLGLTLLFKYLYAAVVLLVELADAAVSRKPMVLFRIENLISGLIVALYLFVWLVLDGAQREAISTMVSGIDANLISPERNALNAFFNLGPAMMFLLLARLFKVPARETAIGFALVLGALIAAWIQLRWYAHHVFPITMAYIAWWWMIRRYLKPLWLIALGALICGPILAGYLNSAYYQASVREIDDAVKEAGLSVEGKRVGVLIMNPSPLNQFLAANGGLRWNATVNNAYVAAELKDFDRPENAGLPLPAVKLENPGRQMLHDEMLRLWEDMPPDVLILDHSRSWPLRHIEVRWQQVFADEPRFQAVMKQYRPVLDHDGKLLEFTYLERIEE